jgi:FtsZ-binding cell division protein ZapB
MFFKNSTRFPTNDSEYQPTTHLKPVEDNPYTKVLSGISMQPSLYPSNLNNVSLAKRDKTPPALRPPEAKKRTDISVESSEGHNGNDDEATLRAELQDTKSKMKVITTKINTMRKEKDQLQKENQSLQEEVLSLQVSLRHMIPGFSNTSGSFPMLNELIGKIHEFYKCECEDIFFDLLCPELSMKGIIYFFKTAFQRLTEVVDRYFKPTEELLKKTGCFGDIEGPLMNAMRKSYQSTWKEILEKCILADGMKRIAQEVNGNLKLGDESEETQERIEEFLEKMGELLLCLYISDPTLKPNMEDIGSKVVYNPMKHEPLDGFIKAKEECIVVLPSVHKITVDGEVVTKALVLQVGYEVLN